jgi:hypothetical protein
MITVSLKLATALLVLAATVRTRVQKQVAERGSDAGISTLEIVVIGLGLFLVAGLAVAAFTGAINTRLSQIK